MKQLYSILTLTKQYENKYKEKHIAVVDDLSKAEEYVKHKNLQFSALRESFNNAMDNWRLLNRRPIKPSGNLVENLPDQFIYFKLLYFLEISVIIHLLEKFLGL